VQMDVREKQLLTVKGDIVRNADIADVPAGARGIHRLHHGFLSADTFQHRLSADSIGQFLDARNTFISSLSHNIGRTKFAGEFLTRFVAAHRDDSRRAHLFGGEHAEQADGAVTDDRNGRARFHVSDISSEPACAHYVGEGQ